MARITQEQMQAWARDKGGIKAKFNNQYVAYKRFCENPPAAYQPPPAPPKPKRINSMEALAVFVELDNLRASQQQPASRPKTLAEMSPEQQEAQWRAEYRASSQLQGEFIFGEETYVAYKKR